MTELNTFEVVATTLPNFQEKNSLQVATWECDTLKSAEWLISEQFPNAKKISQESQTRDCRIIRYDNYRESLLGNLIKTEIKIYQLRVLPNT